MEIDYGCVDRIEKIFEFHPTINIIDLVKKYLRDSRNLSSHDVDKLYIEEDGIDDEIGYMVVVGKGEDAEYLGFSDMFVTTFPEDEEDAIATIDPIWINILADKLFKHSGFEENQYLFDIYRMIEDYGRSELNMDKPQLKALRDRLIAIDARKFTPQKQTLSEADITAYFAQNVD